MNKKLHGYITGFVLFIIVLASSWALLRTDFFTFHDFTQGARIIEMSQALRDGHFPVIWSSNLGYGYGMPLFEFYAPLPYYVGSFFYLLGFSLINSVKAIILITSIFTAIGAYLLGRKLFGTTGGLLVSAAVTLAPYRAVNLFVRGAISEAWGIMALPFILLGIIKTVKSERYGWVILVTAITVLLLSHNLTALVFLPFSVLFGAGYIFIEARSSKRIKQSLVRIVFQLAGLYVLAVILSSFYTLPALLEKDFTRLEATILSGYFDYNIHFVGLRQFFIENWGYGGSTYGPQDGISFYLGFGQLLGLFLSLYVLLREMYRKFRRKAKISFTNKQYLYLVITALFGLSALLTTSKLAFIWNAVQFLEFLQFPWRYLSAVIIFLGLAVGSLVIILPNKLFRYAYTLVLISVLLVVNARYFAPNEFTADVSEYYYEDVNKLRYQMSNTLPDYIPAQITQNTIEPVALEGQVLYCQALNNCENNFGIIEDAVHQKSVRIFLEEDQDLIFTVANYPGWTATLDGTAVEIVDSEDGFIQVTVPAGEHVVSVELKNTQVRSLANLITILGLVIFLATFFWYYKKQ